MKPGIKVKVIVHESKVDSIQPGMRAGIKIQEREFHGEVTSVASQPEPTSWMNTSIKEYATIVRIEKAAMVRVLHDEPIFSELFMAYLLSRNIRIEEDLVDQLFNSS